MTVLTPEEASKAISFGRVHTPIKVNGRLDLSKFEGECLPAGLQCYELDARGSKLKNLPEDLKIDGRLILDNCENLTSLPIGLTSGSISLRNCVSLRKLPEGINTWFLDMTGCTSFEEWPENGTVHSGSLILRNCIALRSLPRWVGRLAHLSIAGCAQISEIPEGISVTGWVDIGGSVIVGLPASMEGAPLRWRGVRIDERIAFHPDELTAEEALSQKNVELRRVIIERMGYLRFAKESKAKVIDSDTDSGGARQLLRIELREDEALVGLSCHCPSTGRQYFLRVPPTMKTCHQAAAWMAGFDNPALYSPLIET